MKIWLLTVLLASVAALASAADPASLSGEWQVQNSIGSSDTEQACTFTQKDGELTGKCTSERGTVQVSGKVEGTTVTWTYKTQYEGSPLTVTYKGTLDSANKITGSVNVEEMGMSGRFTATQPK